MKQLRIASSNDPTLDDLLWVDEIAALLPENLRLGWYRNVKSWIATLPPEDEVAHLAYAMGYLGLLIRECPAMVAAEREKLTTALQQISKEIVGGVAIAAAYHQKLDERLNKLPAEVANGLNSDAFAAKLVDGIRDQFIKSGIPQAGELMNEQGNRLRHLLTNQAETLSKLERKLRDAAEETAISLRQIHSANEEVTKSLTKWNGRMVNVQLVHLALSMAIGLLLGVFLFWYATVPTTAAQSLPHAESEHKTPATRPSTATTPQRTKRHGAN